MIAKQGVLLFSEFMNHFVLLIHGWKEWNQQLLLHHKTCLRSGDRLKTVGTKRLNEVTNIYTSRSPQFQVIARNSCPKMATKDFQRNGLCQIFAIWPVRYIVTVNVKLWWIEYQLWWRILVRKYLTQKPKLGMNKN